MAVGVIDNFNGSHGPTVEDSIERHYTSRLIEFNLGDSTVSIERISRELVNVLDLAESENINGVNISFGDYHFNTDPGKFLVHEPTSGMGENHYLQRDLWDNDILLAISSGNRGWDAEEGQVGVTYLSSSPYSLSVGALGNNGDIASFSQFAPNMTESFANGYEGSSRGTSFSSPKVLGALTEAKEKYGLSNPETYTLFERTADAIEAPDGYTYYTLDASELLDYGGPVAIDDYQRIDAAIELFHGRQPHANEVSEIISSTEDIGDSPWVNFDSEFYLTTYRDVALAVEDESNKLDSAFEHYLLWGENEGRDPSVMFDESSYLDANPDVAEAVHEIGNFRSGFHHYQMFGQNEGRDPTPDLEESVFDFAVQNIAETAENQNKVPTIDRVQALWHVGLGEEAPTVEMGDWMFDSLNESWTSLTDKFLNEFQDEFSVYSLYAFSQFTDAHEVAIA